jgi:excisionase family DNA binding protein
MAPKAAEPEDRDDAGMNVDKVAEALAISRRTAYALIAKGEIRTFKIGGAVRVTRAELRRYLAAAKRAK